MSRSPTTTLVVGEPFRRYLVDWSSQRPLVTSPDERQSLCTVPPYPSTLGIQLERVLNHTDSAGHLGSAPRHALRSELHGGKHRRRCISFEATASGRLTTQLLAATRAIPLNQVSRSRNPPTRVGKFAYKGLKVLRVAPEPILNFTAVVCKSPSH